MAQIHERGGKVVAATEETNRAIGLMQAALVEKPNDPDFQQTQSALYIQMSGLLARNGDLEGAVKSMRSAIPVLVGLFHDYPNTKYRGVFRSQRDVLSKLCQQIGNTNTVTRLQNELDALTAHDPGLRGAALLTALEDSSAMIRSRRQLLELRKQAIDAGAATEHDRASYVDDCQSLSGICWRANHGEDAVAWLRASDAELHRLIADFPDVAKYRQKIMSIALELSEHLKLLNRWQEIEPVCRRAISAIDPVGVESWAKYDLAKLHHRLGSALKLSGRIPEAINEMREAVVRFKAGMDENPGNQNWRMWFANSSSWLSDMLTEEKQLDDAVVHLRNSVEAQHVLSRTLPDPGCTNVVTAYQKLGQADSARQFIDGLTPRSAADYVIRAQLHELLVDKAAAATDYEKAVELDFSNATARQALERLNTM